MYMYIYTCTSLLHYMYFSGQQKYSTLIDLLLALKHL